MSMTVTLAALRVNHLCEWTTNYASESQTLYMSHDVCPWVTNCVHENCAYDGLQVTRCVFDGHACEPQSLIICMNESWIVYVSHKLCLWQAHLRTSQSVICMNESRTTVYESWTMSMPVYGHELCLWQSHLRTSETIFCMDEFHTVSMSHELCLWGLWVRTMSMTVTLASL